jgi:hypothetical protein
MPWMPTSARPTRQRPKRHRNNAKLTVVSEYGSAMVGGHDPRRRVRNATVSGPLNAVNLGRRKARLPVESV